LTIIINIVIINEKGYHAEDIYRQGTGIYQKETDGRGPGLPEAVWDPENDGG